NELCDYCIKVPSSCTPRIQEAHILIGHIICAIVEEELFGKGF
ncbi:phosphoheptose isomerase, partial [Campylobacter insulaenigrae]|nr:phosphoheptose isomerase [Campylobacter insulaenigrae]MCR6586986.1 phosphoheptose isomerase [Campylobacter insulaenigrae]